MLPGYMMIRRTLPVFVLALMATLTTALAHEGPGGLINPQRDCMTIRTCNGRLTATEALGHREFVLTKLYRSA